MRSLGVLSILVLAACRGTPDYGPSTNDTHISIKYDGMLFLGGVEIDGTRAMYRDATRTKMKPIARIVVNEMIRALAEVRFLERDSDCKVHPDELTVTIQVRLAAGSHTLRFPYGCAADLDELAHSLEQTSGYADFHASR